MKVAVINFSGNVGKSTVAKHLLLPRIDGARFFSVESINMDEGGEKVRGKEYSALHEEVMLSDAAVVDVGASNIEDFVKLMKQVRGSHQDFDSFVVPVIKDKKQQFDTMATIDALREMGVPAKKIRVVFNKLETDDDFTASFAPLLAFHEDNKNFVLSPKAVVVQNDIFDRIKGTEKQVHEIAADETDYRAIARAAQSRDEKLNAIDMVQLQGLAISAKENLDEVFKSLFK